MTFEKLRQGEAMRGIDIDREALKAIPEPDGPIVMINLFRLKDKAQFGEFLQAMQSASAQAIDAASAEPVYAGEIGGEFIAGDDYWHKVMLVRYPSFSSFLAALADGDAFEKARDIRRKYLDDARFILTTPLGGPTPKHMTTFGKNPSGPE